MRCDASSCLYFDEPGSTGTLGHHTDRQSHATVATMAMLIRSNGECLRMKRCHRWRTLHNESAALSSGGVSRTDQVSVAAGVLRGGLPVTSSGPGIFTWVLLPVSDQLCDVSSAWRRSRAAAAQTQRMELLRLLLGEFTPGTGDRGGSGPFPAAL